MSEYTGDMRDVLEVFAGRCPPQKTIILEDAFSPEEQDDHELIVNTADV